VTDALDVEDVKVSLDDVKAQLTTAHLVSRMLSALRIVEATVQSVQLLPSDPPISEHAFEPAEASVVVSADVSGDSSEMNLTVLFDTSTDVARASEPKLTQGQDAILLLQANTDTADSSAPFMVIDASDVLPSAQLPRIIRIAR
jgi:hypothetical protein